MPTILFLEFNVFHMSCVTCHSGLLVLLPFLKPCWHSGRSFSSSAHWLILCANSVSSTFDIVGSSVMGRKCDGSSPDLPGF